MIASQTASTQAVLKPLLYADIFDYPLTLEEVYRFLEVDLPFETTQQLLAQAVAEQMLEQVGQFYCLPEKSHLIATRQQRWQMAQQLWGQAFYYGRWIASLPFVRMVAVTGSLAVDNPAEHRDDIDFLIVTQPQRLWLCRAMVIGLVRYGRLRGSHLCPNYMLTERVLQLEERSFYAARELMQMVPLYGKPTYCRLRQLNSWVTEYLPHGDALNLTHLHDALSWGQRWGKQGTESLLRGGLGDALERALQRYQIRKHTRLAAQHGARDRVLFTADQCKGHYDSHGDRTLRAYEERVQGL